MALNTYTPADSLFSTFDSNKYWYGAQTEVQNEIREFGRKSFLETDDQTLLRRFEARYKKEPLKLLDGITKNSDEKVNVDVSTSQNNFNLGLGPQYVPTPLIKYYIPFEGDKSLFEFGPNFYSSSPQRGFVVGNTLCVPILASSENNPDTDSAFERQKAQITSTLEAVNKKFADLGTTFSSSILEMIHAQRKVFEQQQLVLDSSRYPERK